MKLRRILFGFSIPFVMFSSVMITTSCSKTPNNFADIESGQIYKMNRETAVFASTKAKACMRQIPGPIEQTIGTLTNIDFYWEFMLYSANVLLKGEHNSFEITEWEKIDADKITVKATLDTTILSCESAAVKYEENKEVAYCKVTAETFPVLFPSWVYKLVTIK